MGSKWIEHVKTVYAEKKKKDPNYKYKEAMKDAKKTYKKGSGKEEPKKKKRRPAPPKKYKK